MAGHVDHTRLTGASCALGNALITLGVCGALLVATAGCGPREPDIPPTAADADKLLFDRGQAAMVEEDWTRARQYFVQIRDTFPQSPLRAAARLGVADSHEGQGTTANYVSALAELQEFLRLYPTHPLAAYAQYKVGMVYYHQMRGPQRDQSETREAVHEFELFIDRAVNDQTFAVGVDDGLMGEVRAKLRDARDRLSDASFIVGRYYYRNKYYPGAIDRFRAILDEDPGYTRRDQVYFYLATSLEATNMDVEALPMFERLVAEFPETDYLDEASDQIAELKVVLDLQDR